MASTLVFLDLRQPEAHRAHLDAGAADLSGRMSWPGVAAAKTAAISSLSPPYRRSRYRREGEKRRHRCGYQPSVTV